MHLGNQKPGVWLGTETCDQLSWHFKTKCVWHSLPLSEHINSAFRGKKNPDEVLWHVVWRLLWIRHNTTLISICPNWEPPLSLGLYTILKRLIAGRKKPPKTAGVLNDANYDSILTAGLQLDLLSFMWLITPAFFLRHVCNNTEVK